MKAPFSRTVDITGLRTESEANDHAHWRERQKRAKHARGTVLVVLGANVRRSTIPALVLDVTLTRVAPSSGLDDDNLRPALKHARDGVADFLGLKSDRDPRVAWHYAQERGPWAVRITIAARATEAAAPGETVLELSDEEVATLEEAFRARVPVQLTRPDRSLRLVWGDR